MKSFAKRISAALVSLLLSLNIGCSSLYSRQLPAPQQKNLEQLTEPGQPGPSKLRAWQYPVNIAGGLLLTAVAHESGHALAGSLYGAEIERLEIPYTNNQGDTYICSLLWKTLPEPGSTGDTMLRLGGPLAQRAFIESINYNLRRGNISMQYQPFWATTSLFLRYFLIENAIGGLKENFDNDFYRASQNTGISTEAIAGLVFLDVLLNYKRIAQEFNVAIGKAAYEENTKKGNLSLLPFPEGVSLFYKLDF